MMFVLAALLLTVGAYAQDNQQGGPRGGHHMPSVDDQVAALKQAVNLSDDQAAKVHDILQAQRDKAQQMMQDESMSREDRRAKMQAMRQDSNNQIRALLSDDQKKSFDSFEQQRQNNWGNRRHDQGNGPN